MSNESKSSRYERSFLSNPAISEPQVAPAGRKSSSPARMYGLLALAMFCWGGNPVAGKEALQGFGPLALSQVRLLLAALVYMAGFLAWRNRPRLKLNRRECLFLVAVALVGASLNQLFFIEGLSRSSVVHSALISATGPVIVLVISCLARLETLTVQKMVGMTISFGGVAWLAISRANQIGGSYWLGDVLLLGASVTFATYTILVKEIADRYDVLTMNALVFALGATLFTPIGIRSVLRVNWAGLSTSAWLGLLYMVVLGSVVPYLLYAFALTELTASRAAAFTYVSPLVAVVLGAWWLREKLTLQVMLCGVMILLGVYLTERGRDNEEAVGKPEKTAP
jgi:drug/metabolite transporter (DMT)-like permease